MGNAVDNRREVEKLSRGALRPVCYPEYIPAMQTALAEPSHVWATGLWGRLREVRLARGLSLQQAKELTGLMRPTFVKLEGGERRNLYIDQLVPMARAYDIPLVSLVLGWQGSKIPRGFVEVDVDALHRHIRATLRRQRGSIGTKALAERADVEQSTIVRWESGEYRRLDMIRLYRLAQALEVDLGAWLVVP